MTVSRGIVFISLFFFMSTAVSAFEDADLRLSPAVGWGFLGVDAESSYGAKSDVGMHDLSFGMDISIERHTGNRDLLIGGSLGWQHMAGPFTDSSALGDNPDLSVSTIFVGPSFRYFLNETTHLSGALGLAVLWTSGDDDFLDTSLFGPGFSFGGGYDFPTMKAIQFGLYARMFFHFVFGDDSAREEEYSGSHISPVLGVSLIL